MSDAQAAGVPNPAFGNRVLSALSEQRNAAMNKLAEVQATLDMVAEENQSLRTELEATRAQVREMEEQVRLTMPAAASPSVPLVKAQIDRRPDAVT